jgi:PAS domain S-box-containing protein
MPELKEQSFLQLLDNVLTSGTTYHADEAMVLLNIDGATVTKYFAFIYDPIKDDQGGFNGIICVATEVTSQVIARQEVSQLNQDLQTVNEELISSNEDLKQSQDELRVLNSDLSASKETFRLLADNIAQLAWMADETGNIFWYNQRWYDYTGATFEEMNGWGWQTVHHADHLQRVIKKWSEHLQCGEIWEDVFPLLSKSGEFRWFLSRAIPIRNEEGKIIRWMGTNTDIDDQRKLEQQKDDFLSIASHELKTPITSLKASLQLLDRIKDNPTDQILPKLITQSNKSVQKVSLLVEDLLNVSRVTQGQLKLAKTQFKLSGMIDSCCGHIRLAGEYTVNVEGDINLEVVADEHQVEQVLVNFVNNAIKYAPESKNIYIIIEKLNKTGKVSVKDLGPGIPPDKLKHLFNRYYRATASNNQTAGLGLGLYISAEIIKLHDGEVGVESELGKGSTFWFTLPLD